MRRPSPAPVAQAAGAAAATLALTLLLACTAGAQETRAIITTPPVALRAEGGGEAPQQAAPASQLRLSDERTFTTWAHPLRGGLPIYAAPRRDARKVDHVHLETEDGFPEVYELLASRIGAQGELWIRLRIPGRPNGRIGWVPRTALGAFHRTRWLVVIDLRTRLLSAYRAGRLQMAAPVGVGKPSTPTPPGHFWIRERFRVQSRSNPYWPYALGTSDYSTLTDWPGGGIVGIHGDFGAPQLIPGDPSHGCVRMRDADIAWLAPRLPLGTPVWIY
jgi:hypothetical protein